MSCVCEICGKGKILGNSVDTRGRAKRLKGVGTKVTGITRRAFKPNLQRIRVTTENGTPKTIRVCAQCLRCDAVTRRIVHKPFQFKKAEKKVEEKAAE
ncbi:MAG: 50S ribosomal protein L28 [Thermoguttaceae bacterium]|nr:50S ribosomal protein L28 [Thermoguttaceae bacterium]